MKLTFLTKLKLTIYFLFALYLIIQKLGFYSNFITKIKKEEILKATYKLENQNEDAYGSAFAIKYQGKKFLLTNAHVCLTTKEFNESIKNKKIVNNLKVKNFYLKNYWINKDMYSLTKDENISIKKDLCVMTSDIQDIYYYDLDSNEKGILKYINSYYYFTTVNYAKNLMPYFVKGRLLEKEKNVEVVAHRIKQKKKKQKELTYTVEKSDFADFHVVPGDSGAPVFDGNLNFVGLIYSYQSGDYKKDDLLKEEKLKSRYDYLSEGGSFISWDDIKDSLVF